jgi:pimeloyl-ACP methyl ester carboxylesterase
VILAGIVPAIDLAGRVVFLVLGRTILLTASTEKRISVAGLRLRYWDEGNGPAVVLIHGIAASLEYWRFTVGALAGQHRVLAVDLPGCGLSERGPTIPTLGETADILASLLDELALERASFAGNSMGGLVALEVALRHPNRVDKLILSDSAGLGREISLFWRLAALRPIGSLLIGINQRAALRDWPNLFFDQNGEAGMVERCRQWVARPDLIDTIVSAARSGLDLGGQRPEVVRVDRLGELRAPTLIVWGKNDWIVPVAHAERAHRLILDSRLVILDRCGHCPELEQPLAYNRLVREFLGA